jgi:hypothetical protein
MTYLFCKLNYLPGEEIILECDTKLANLRFVPTSPSELFLGVVFAFPCIIFLVNLVIVLYKCICPRNYAEWRTSWGNGRGVEGGAGGDEQNGTADMYTQVKTRRCSN